MKTNNIIISKIPMIMINLNSNELDLGLKGETQGLSGEIIAFRGIGVDIYLLPSGISDLTLRDITIGVGKEPSHADSKFKGIIGVDICSRFCKYGDFLCFCISISFCFITFNCCWA